MSEDLDRDKLKENVRSEAIWLRFLFMLVFIVALWVSSILVGVVVVFQFLVSLFTSRPNRNLLTFGSQLTEYVSQVLRFLMFLSDERPFPFSAWPEVESRVEVGADED